MEVIPLSAALPVLGVAIWCVWAALSVPENPGAHKFPSTLPLMPPPVIPVSSALPLLLPVSPSTHPQPTICVLGSPRLCQSPSVLWLEDNLSRTPPRPVDPVAPSSLLSTAIHRPSGSASRLHSSGCTSSLHPSGSVRHLLPSGSTLALCRSGSTAAFRILTSVA